jgi:hypothetical protein
MRLFLLILGLYSAAAFSQDSTLIHQSAQGNFAYSIRTKTDTVEIGFYAKNKKEYVISRDKSSKKMLYTRYYRNGKKMWIKEWDRNTENGNCTYFNANGVKVAEFIYSEGTIRDTLFLDQNTHLIIGNLSYTNTVYGGMQREDGSSNVSSYSGPYQFYYMKLIRIDSPKGKVPDEFYFTSDFQGDFIVVLKPGKYGLFPKDFPLKDINENMFSPAIKPSGSTLENWNINSPIIIQKENRIYHFNFHHTSVGYAP